MEEQDLTNFSTCSSSHHRLPTISASEAVQHASARSSRAISTGLPSLDSALAGPRAARPNTSTSASASASQASYGLPRGSVTEIYGPPGVGKTAFAIQAAVNALHSSPRSSSPSGPSSAHLNEVVWIDTGAPLPGPRFSQVFSAAASRTQPPPTTQDSPSSPPAISSAPLDQPLDRVHYISAPTLAHLLVLFLHPTPTFPPRHTALVVVDNVSALFTTSFPRPDRSHAPNTATSATTTFTESVQRKAANRKWAVAGDLAGGMARMAGRHDCAVLVVNQVATSLLKGGGGGGVRKAMLKPSLGGNGWEAGVQGRIRLYWDFAPRDHGEEDGGGGGGAGAEERLRDRESRKRGGGMQFAEVVKVSGKMVGTGTGTGTTTTTTTTGGVVVPFVIEDAGLREIRIRSQPSTSSSPPSTPLLTSSIATEGDRTLKRKAAEIADSGSDDEEEDEVGSEDDLGVLPDEFLA